jgi:ribosomal protein L37E
VKINGDPDVIRIHKIFDIKEDASKYETIFLKKVNAKSSDRWLNKNDMPAPPILYGVENGFYGKTHSDETKMNWSVKRTGRKLSVEHIGKLKNKIPWNKGLIGGKLSDEHIDKLKNKIPWNKGKTGTYSTGKRSTITKNKISAKRLGKKWYHDPVTKHTVCCYSEEVPPNYIPGMIKKSNGLTGKSLKEETKNKLSQKHKNKVFDKQTNTYNMRNNNDKNI